MERLLFGRWTMAGATVAPVALGLILPGGLGNLYDRIHFRFVRDFLHMLPGWNLPFGWHWPRPLARSVPVCPVLTPPAFAKERHWKCRVRFLRTVGSNPTLSALM